MSEVPYFDSEYIPKSWDDARDMYTKVINKDPDFEEYEDEHWHSHKLYTSAILFHDLESNTKEYYSVESQD